jgi:hypothetical protein
MARAEGGALKAKNCERNGRAGRLGENSRQPRAYVLLAVVLKNFKARAGDFGSMLLQAAQNDEVTLVHKQPAVADHVGLAHILLPVRSGRALRRSFEG